MKWREGTWYKQIKIRIESYRDLSTVIFTHSSALSESIYSTLPLVTHTIVDPSGIVAKPLLIVVTSSSLLVHSDGCI